MLDNQLIAKIIEILDAGFISIISAVPVAPIIKQSFQPEQQGANSAPTIYLYKVTDTRLGWPLRTNVWDVETSQEISSEIQQYESTFQLTCWATQDPADILSLTASDILNYAAYIMQSSTTIAALEALGVGVYRVGQVRNPAFSDDRDRYEFAPSLDFVLTHKQIITLTTPIISEYELQILTV